MSATHAGIVHQPPGQSTLEYLPLERVEIKAWIVDVSARIVLTQVFRNASERPTARAKYVFPLPARSAVCAFELAHADGRVITGIVKEKEAAVRSFESAIAGGKTAGLVERVTDDIFAISVGSIPAAEEVTTQITFIMDLLDEGIRDHVRLQLPLAIFDRYGPLPEEMIDAATASSTTCMVIKVDIQTSEAIHAVRSPTHAIKLLRYKTHGGRKSQRRMSALWESTTFLRRDFVLVVHAAGLDKPRCFAEVMGTRSRAGGTIGMQLTLVPSFEVPRIPSQEYIFVIDVSTSMTQDFRIETAKKTLSMLLRLMPSAQTMFNILSFSADVWPLWDSSHAFDHNSLRHAITHVQAMTAHIPGTHIEKALESAFNSRRRDQPTAVFILTDGDVYDPYDAVGSTVSTAVHAAPPQAPLRVFVLGIGDASSSMCESIARAGNGECLFAVSHEGILGKCARLLNAGRTKKIENFKVDWGVQPVPLNSPPESDLDQSSDALQLEPPPPLQQAPHELTKIFAGIRFTVFAIISATQVPSSVKLYTKFDGIDEPCEWDIPVAEVKPFKDSDSEIPLVHTLAARKLITELSEKRAPLPAVIGTTARFEEHIRKAAIVRLGLEYQLASEHTSFVAVESGDERTRSTTRGRGVRGTGWTRSTRRRREEAQPTNQGESVSEEQDGNLLGIVINGVTSALSFIFSAFGANADPSTPDGNPNIPGTYMDSSSSLDVDDEGLRGHSHNAPTGYAPRRNSSIESFTTLSSLEGSCSSCWTSSRSPSPRPRPSDPISRAPSPTLVYDATTQHAGHTTTTHPTLPLADPLNNPPTISNEAYEVFMLLDLDGSFSPSPELKRVVGDEILEQADDLGVDKKLWATVVAVAYLKKSLEKEPDLLDTLLAKTEDFVKETLERGQGHGRLPARFEDMVRYASELLERVGQDSDQ